MKKSEIGKSLRTNIGELAEISDEQLGRVAGGAKANGGLGGIGGGIRTGATKCWQASSSATNPGEPDTYQDYVND